MQETQERKPAGLAKLLRPIYVFGQAERHAEKMCVAMDVRAAHLTRSGVEPDAETMWLYEAGHGAECAASCRTIPNA